MNVTEELALIKEVARLGEGLSNLDKKVTNVENKLEHIRTELESNKLNVVKISTILFFIGGLMSALAGQLIAFIRKVLE